MKWLQGTGTSGGIAEGPVYVVRKKQYDIRCLPFTDPEEEGKRFEAARQLAMERLSGLYETAVSRAGEESDLLDLSIGDVYRDVGGNFRINILSQPRFNLINSYHISS